MYENCFKLELFKDGKELLTQWYDTMPLARKAGMYFLSTSEQDGIERGFRITDTRFDLEVIKKGGVPDDRR